MIDEKQHESDESQEPERKERVIHTRVPAVLEQELKRLATSLKLPVSNVVRTILEDAVTAVDSVGQVAEGELRHAAERLSRQRDALRTRHHVEPAPSRHEESAPSAAPLEGIVGYQPLMLARQEHCSLCARPLSVGSNAYLGIRDRNGPRILLGEECLPFAANDSKEK